MPLFKNIIYKITQKFTRKTMKEFIAGYSSNGLTLDVGCNISFYKEYFPNRIGIDIIKVPGVDVIADVHNLPFEDNKFDNILCTEVLEHLHSPHIAVKEMRRVLKKGGKLILTTRFLFPLHDTPDDFFRFSKYGLLHLFKDWSLIELKEEATSIQTIAVLLQRIGYQTELKGGKITKLFLFLLAKFVWKLSFLIKKEFGSIHKDKPEKNILTSGYYLACKKK